MARARSAKPRVLTNKRRRTFEPALFETPRRRQCSHLRAAVFALPPSEPDWRVAPAQAWRTISVGAWERVCGTPVGAFLSGDGHGFTQTTRVLEAPGGFIYAVHAVDLFEQED